MAEGTIRRSDVEGLQNAPQKNGWDYDSSFVNGFDYCIKRVLALPDAEGEGWRPIKSAPKDPSVSIIVWSYRWFGQPELGRWTYKRSYISTTSERPPEGWGPRVGELFHTQPTIWMPLPAPPQQEQAESVTSTCADPQDAGSPTPSHHPSTESAAETCPSCAGTGLNPNYDCDDCAGTGRIKGGRGDD